MLPSAFVRLDALPLTPNGKVDRRALPAPNSTLATSGESFVAPTQLVHYQLQQIWEELLEVRPIGIRDNFFYLGGHSLLAARLLNRIEQSFGKKLSLATLFAGPTIEQLANALQTEEQGSRVPVIPLQVNGSRRPFFYLHGNWNSEAFYCYALARHLGPDQPFYALEPYHFEGLCVPPTIEAMAAAHLEAIRAVQPEGPYVLGGFCNGGLVAYEMARQLQAQGEQVETLLRSTLLLVCCSTSWYVAWSIVSAAC
jgi:acyl carrier protein